MDGPLLINTSTEQTHHFENKTEFLIGRSVDSDLDIPSQYISRKQCIIRLNGNHWTLQNLSSLDTTQLNKKRIDNELTTLKNGDTISFVNSSCIEYQFFTSIHDYNILNNIKRRKLNSPVKNNEIKNYEAQLKEFKELKELYATTLTKTEFIAAEAKALTEKNNEQSIYIEKFKSQTHILESENQKLQERIFQLEKTQQELTLEFNEHASMLEDSNEEIKRIAEERNEIAKELSSRMEVILTDSDEKGTAGELMNFIELEAIRSDLAAATSQLKESELNICQISEEKERFFDTILNTVEQEFSCCVCSDIMYEATTLNCRHTLCRFCLSEWKKKKKECPECRTKIKTETHNLTIDRFLDRVTPLLGESFIQKRKELIDDRVKAIAPNQNSSSGRVSHFRSNRRRGPYAGHRSDYGDRGGRFHHAETIDLTSPSTRRREGISRRRTRNSRVELGDVVTNRDHRRPMYLGD